MLLITMLLVDVCAYLCWYVDNLLLNRLIVQQMWLSTCQGAWCTAERVGPMDLLAENVVVNQRRRTRLPPAPGSLGPWSVRCVGWLSAGAGIGALGAELRVAMPVCGGMARWGLGTFKKERLLLQRNKQHDERSQGQAWAACLHGVGASGIYLSPGLLRVVPEASGGPLPQPLIRVASLGRPAGSP